MPQPVAARLAVDIGGTFTDLALEHDGRQITAKVLTTPAAPEQAVLAGLDRVLADAGLAPGALDLVIHGTTLATNAIIERKGARTALLTTEGFRDVLAMRNESRYDQYDLNIVLPEPLVPRHLRLPVPERLDNEGQVLRPLDEAARARPDPPAAARTGGGDRGRLSARLRQSRPRAAHARHSRRCAARHPGVAVVRGLAGDARMGALLHHRRQRLRAAADGTLPAPPGSRAARARRGGAAVPDAVGRRADHGGNRLPLPDPPGGKRPGRGRDFRCRAGARGRAGSRALVRHGRHHGENLPDRRRPAADLPQFRGRPYRAVPQRVGTAVAHPGHRDGGDRRRRRLARAGRCAGADRGRAGQRRCRSGAGLLRPRRHGAGGDGRQPAARPLRSRALRRRQPGARCRRGAGCDGRLGGRPAGADAGAGVRSA